MKVLILASESEGVPLFIGKEKKSHVGAASNSDSASDGSGGGRGQTMNSNNTTKDALR